MQQFFQSFKHAFNGIIHLIWSERNFKIHLIALLFVVAAAFYFSVTVTEWMFLLIVSALVLSMEALNSAIERLCDLYSTEFDDRIKLIKDIAAGAVLISAIFAIVIALIVFCKYLF